MRLLFLVLLLISCVEKKDRSSSVARETANCEGCVFEKGGYDRSSSAYEIPVSFVFINSYEESSLSFNVRNDASRILASLNNFFNDFEGHQHLKFRIFAVENVFDEELYRGSCSDLSVAMERYGKRDSLTIIFNKELTDSCSGSAFLWTKPTDVYSGAILQYTPNSSEATEVIAHELGHNIGLHHTSMVFSGSAPATGALNFNSLLDMIDLVHPFNFTTRNLERCDNVSDISYFIDSEISSTATDYGGNVYNSFENLMYPTYGDGLVRSFFSQGYEEINYRVFDCWYQIAQSL
jgi:hypothetical protein